MTTGEKNTILGGFSGNNNGLNIIGSDNVVVLSDGDGAPAYINRPYTVFQTGGRYTAENPLYEGAASGWDSSSSANTWTTITAINMNDGIFHAENAAVIRVIIYTLNLNPTYGYYSISTASWSGAPSNTASYTGQMAVATDGNGNSGSDLPTTSECHTATTSLIFRLRVFTPSAGVGKVLQVYSNIVPSGSAAAPTMKIASHVYNRF